MQIIAISILLVMGVLWLILPAIKMCHQNPMSYRQIFVSGEEIKVLASCASDYCVSSKELYQRLEAFREKYNLQPNDLQSLELANGIWEHFFAHHPDQRSGLA